MSCSLRAGWIQSTTIVHACMIVVVWIHPLNCMTFLMMACSKLSTSDLSKVRNEILPAAAKWYDIGLELGMSADYLDTIKANNNPQECSLKMLRQWLLAEPSWEARITALRSPTINYSALASKIENKYCSVEPAIETHQQPVD